MHTVGIRFYIVEVTQSHREGGITGGSRRPEDVKHATTTPGIMGVGVNSEDIQGTRRALKGQPHEMALNQHLRLKLVERDPREVPPYKVPPDAYTKTALLLGDMRPPEFPVVPKPLLKGRDVRDRRVCLLQRNKVNRGE